MVPQSTFIPLSPKSYSQICIKAPVFEQSDSGSVPD